MGGLEATNKLDTPTNQIQLGGRLASSVNDGIGGYLKAGFTAAILLVGGLGGWAASATLAGAILAQGTVVVDSNVRKVQHHVGGIVGEIRVRDGDMVNAGDVVVRLDETITRATLGVINKQLDAFDVVGCRLKAQSD